MNAARLTLIWLTFLGIAPSAFAQGVIDVIAWPDPHEPVVGILPGGSGWSFVPTVNIRVSELGVGNNGGIYDVTLWTSSFQPMRSVTITPPWENSGETFTSISPITLFAGNLYYVGAEVGGGETVGFAKMYLVGASFAPQLQGLAQYLIHEDGGWHGAPAYDGVPILGPTFRFDVVPEPTVLNLGLTLAGVLILRRRLKPTAKNPKRRP